MSVWTEERDALLRKLVLDGQSYSQVARALGGGVTRNAAIGRANRMGLSRDPARQAIQRQAWAQADATRKRKAVEREAFRRAKAAAKPSEPRPPRAPSPKPAPVTVASPNARPWMQRRPGECKWPIGERGDIQSCCNPIAHGSFCEGHAVLGYDPRWRTTRSGLRIDTHTVVESQAVWHTRHERQDAYHARVAPRPERPATIWDEGRAA